MRRLIVFVMLMLVAVSLPRPVGATFPGGAGRLAIAVTEFIDSDPVSSTTDIFTIDVDGTGLEQVTDTPEREATVRWSPDGEHIAYVAGDATGHAVAVVPSAGGEPTVLMEVSAPAVVHDTAWSPDGGALAVLAEHKAGYTDISIVNVDGSSGTFQTSLNGTGPGTIDWSPDGEHLATSLRLDSDYPDLILVPLDGRPPQMLVAGADPSWSPDGASLVFVGEAGTSIIGADGSDLRTIPGLEYGEPPGAGLTVGYYPVWSPAGDEIAVISFFGVSVDIVDVATGDRRQVMSPIDGSVGMVDWQPIPFPGGFFDVPETHLFAEDIAWLAAEGITKGCNPPLNTLFCPVRALSRAEAAALLVRALHLPAGPENGNRFVDDDGTVFEADIEALANAGITVGCNPPNNDRYCPHDKLTRGQAAALLVRALDLPAAAPDADHFDDAAGSVFEADIEALAGSHITRGCDPPANTLFCPNRHLTRAEAAALLHRASLLGWLS